MKFCNKTINFIPRKFEDMRYKHLLQVFCDDSSQLVLDVIARRGMNPQTSDVHCGFDGGQEMLKLGVTITDRQELDESGRAFYSQVATFFP
jgi:hypothetical protein